MPLILNGSTGISGTDGSAGTPAVQGTDTNTGMFFPAADQIAFAEGGVEAMRLDASGNVGIGTATPGVRLGVLSSVNGNDGIFYTNASTGASAQAILGVAASGALGLQIGQNYSSRNSFIYLADNATLTFSTNAIPRVSITDNGFLQFNSGYGSVATAFGCRAWVNFNGTGTVAIRASGNVSSITDNNTGDYTVNFTNAMPDANYAVVTGSATNSDPGGGGGWNMVTRSPSTNTTTGTRLLAGVQNTLYDVVVAHVAVFR